MPLTPRAIDPNFAQSLADGLIESYEDYCERLADQQPAPDEEVSE
jgi:hypothetical protein